MNEFLSLLMYLVMHSDDRYRHHQLILKLYFLEYLHFYYRVAIPFMFTLIKGCEVIEAFEGSPKAKIEHYHTYL